MAGTLCSFMNQSQAEPESLKQLNAEGIYTPDQIDSEFQKQYIVVCLDEEERKEWKGPFKNSDIIENEKWVQTIIKNCVNELGKKGSGVVFQEEPYEFVFKKVYKGDTKQLQIDAK